MSKKKFGYDPDTGTWNGFPIRETPFPNETSAREFVDAYQKHLQNTGKIDPLLYVDRKTGLYCDHPITGYERPEELFAYDYEAAANQDDGHDDATSNSPTERNFPDEASAREFVDAYQECLRGTGKIDPLLYVDRKTGLYCDHPITGYERPEELFAYDYEAAATIPLCIPEPVSSSKACTNLQEHAYEDVPAEAEASPSTELILPQEATIPQLQTMVKTIVSTVPTILNTVLQEQDLASRKQSKPSKKEKEPVPTHMQLAEKLISNRDLCRVKSKLYLFYDSYYHALDSNSEDTLIFTRLHEDLKVTGHANQFDGIKRFLTADPSILAENLIQPTNLLNVQNGILDLACLTPYTLPSQHSSRVFFTSCLQAPWDLHATCPRFDAFLHKVTGGDAAMIERFWQVLGYNLVPDQNRGKVFTFLYGVSHSGKSVFADLLASFFPEDVVSSVSTHDMEGPFGYEGLVGKEINICAELPSAPLMSKATGKIKAITGGDTVNVNEKNVKTYKAKLNVKLVYASNHPIFLSSADDAFKQRCIELPFPHEIPAEQRDRFLKEKLYTERAGILYKAILAYLRLRNNNYIFPLEGIYQSHVYWGRNTERVSPQDDVLNFIETACVLDPHAKVHTCMLFDRYHQLAPSKNWTSFANEHAFGCCLQSVISRYLPNVQKDKFRINGIPKHGYIGLGIDPPL